MTKMILCFLTMTTLFVGCVSAPVMIATDSDNGKSLRIKKGDTIELRLEAQMSTGFGWEIRSINGLSQKGKIKIITETTDKTGGKDIQDIIFSADQKGEGNIEMIYVQPWQKKNNPEKIFRLDITIE